jgi:FkbM family methyltransferase
MSLIDRLKTWLDRDALRPLLAAVATELAKRKGHGVRRIFYDQGTWVHETASGFFCYQQPYVRLDMAQLDNFARTVFLRHYRPEPGHVIVDIGAGAGEEVLTFSRAVGDTGKLVSIEAHPRTFHRLQKMVKLNHLKNVIPVHLAIGEPSCSLVTIEDSSRYLRNRVDTGGGIPVPAATVDALRQKLNLGTIHFLKMNIEGAERLAIRGMQEALRQVEVVCVCCHDFLADTTGDERLRTKAIVGQFFRQAGLRVLDRPDEGLPAYVRDQVWAYNQSCIEKIAS